VTIPADTRRRICKAVRKGAKIPSIAFHYDICVNTVRTIIATERKHGTVFKPKEQRHGSVILSETDLKYIQNLVDERPELFLDEIRHLVHKHLGKDVHLSTVSRAMKLLGINKKKLRLVARQQSAMKQAKYLIALTAFRHDQLVFLDEMHSDRLNYNRQYGWAPVGVRPRMRGLYIKGVKYSVCGALHLDGLLTHLTITGGFKSKDYTFFVKNNLLPKMNPFPGKRSVIVADNASIHHGKELADLCEQHGIKLLFLPPYSPEYNPIEIVFSKVKKYLQRYGTEKHDAGQTGMSILFEAFGTITPSDAKGFYRKCGYKTEF